MSAANRLRDHFFGWQCLIRQIAMRQDGGRPSAGMRPRVLVAGREVSPALTVLLVPNEPAESTALFRFQVEKTSDPKEVYERGLGLLQGDYFQEPSAFSDRLTAVLPQGSDVTGALLDEGNCLLEFYQGQQHYSLPSTVSALKPKHAAYQASLWHNRLFNPSLPDDVRILSFKPDWGRGFATPKR